MTTPAWNPELYEKFKTQRSQPFFDLISLVDRNLPVARAVDLGCGTGELTSNFQKEFGIDVIGIDNSPEMLKKADNFSNNQLRFQNASIESWLENPKNGLFNAIISNAAIQWCENHPKLFTLMRDKLLPDGQLAVQMPMNHDYPTHLLVNEMSKEPRWKELLNSEIYDKDSTMLSPEAYAKLLFTLGFKKQKVFVRVYDHVLEKNESVIEWVKGTTLTHFKKRLSPTDYSAFENEYRDRLLKILPNEVPFFYPFKRIFIWGVRG